MPFGVIAQKVASAVMRWPSLLMVGRTKLFLFALADILGSF